jgi:hypothetical protein
MIGRSRAAETNLRGLGSPGATKRSVAASTALACLSRDAIAHGRGDYCIGHTHNSAGTLTTTTVIDNGSPRRQ